MKNNSNTNNKLIGVILLNAAEEAGLKSNHPFVKKMQMMPRQIPVLDLC